MSRVLVLMSTYNGEHFIDEQINCILKQEDVDIYLLIRDDGSSDRTREIIKRYCSLYNNIKYYEGNNLGFTYSFYDLIKNASGYDYYALADQDDFWEKRKISRAIEMMNDKYIMYASNLSVVDQNLNYIHDLYQNFDYEEKLLKRCFPFYNPFGCTIVWKDELQKKIKLPNLRVPHDLWIHISANFHGNVYIDKESFILHRIHANNACGIGSKFLERIRKLKKFYLSDFRTTTNNSLLEAIRLYGLTNLSTDEATLVKIILDYPNGINSKWKLFNCEEMKMVKLKRRLEFLLLIILNKF